jgi:selenium donor protein
VVLDRTDAEYRLTRYTHGLGCACKLQPQALEKVLSKMAAVDDPSVLVGADTADDAAVYKLDETTAIVQTVDFITPIVDDPYLYGAISAANSLSDIYAMGAKPLFALNVVAFPASRLPLAVLEEVLRGASDKAEEAGIGIIGGHTIDDTEPKFGLVVTGTVNPERVVRNSTALPGDVLILTKPLGSGIVSTAVKQGLADDAAGRRAAELMAGLNRIASEAMLDVGVSACTDITGFGLLGHLHEMAVASGVDVTVACGEVPTIPEAWTLASAGAVPGGTLANLDYVEGRTTFSPEVSHVARLILADAQTSGGLLVSLPAHRAAHLLAELRRRGSTDAAVIGSVSAAGTGHITVQS